MCGCHTLFVWATACSWACKSRATQNARMCEATHMSMQLRACAQVWAAGCGHPDMLTEYAARMGSTVDMLGVPQSSSSGCGESVCSPRSRERASP
eukprot:365619-Chlamydomonas_euryale.AAC.21